MWKKKTPAALIVRVFEPFFVSDQTRSAVDSKDCFLVLFFGRAMGSAREMSVDFTKLKTNLIQNRKLYDDPEFPAGPKAIGGEKSDRAVLWMRPKDISANAKFIVKGATRFDLYQGDLGNCWFVAACASLATSHQQLIDWCVPPDQDFDRDYAGIFQFRFWLFGSWVEVIIDDLLPCKEVNQGEQRSYQLMYARNNAEPNEFWVPLFEKAYAKLNGSYMNLDSGLINDALVDFTGGISERFDVAMKRRSPGNLFETLSAMVKMASLVGTHIISPDGRVKELPNGLYTGHAYSVTRIEQLRGTSHRLLRLRNPWGKSEWKGAWSDGSKEWSSIPDSVKREIEFEKLEDGEFWISFDDWLRNFNRMAMCHLSPDALTQEVLESNGIRMWNQSTYMAEWVTGFNAGGSPIGFSSRPSKSFLKNPQFPVSLDASNQQPEGKCHVVVSLMQRPSNNQYSLNVGFSIAQLKEGVQIRPIGQNYSENEVGSTQMVNCQPFREVSGHFDLVPGNYIVIPYTQFSNTNGEFLVRIYTEQ